MPDIANSTTSRTDTAFNPKDSTHENNAVKGDPAAQFRAEANTSSRQVESAATAGLPDLAIIGTSKPVEITKPVESKTSVDAVTPADNAELPIKSIDDISKIWTANPKSYVQKGYFEINALQVNEKSHPNGVIISTTEAPMVLQKDLPIPGQFDAEGKPLILKAGTALPNGVQFSPSTVVENGKDAKDAPIRIMDDVTLLTPKDGIRLADGTLLKSVGLGEVEIASGQVAQPGSIVIQRSSTDLKTGKPRIDTYTEKEAKFGKNWVEVPGKPGVFSPNLNGTANMEVVQVPPGESFKFKASYDLNGPWVEAKPGDFIKADIQNGEFKGYYRVSAQDALETHVPTDAATTIRLNELAESIKAKTGAVVLRAGTDVEAFTASKKATEISEIRPFVPKEPGAAPRLDTMAQADIGKTVNDFGQHASPEVLKGLFMDAVHDPALIGRYLEQFKDPAERESARDMLDKVNGLSESERKVFDETMAKDQKAALDLGGKDIPEGRGSDVMGKIGTAVAVLVIISTAIALAKAAHASEAPKKKVPFFQS